MNYVRVCLVNSEIVLRECDHFELKNDGRLYFSDKIELYAADASRPQTPIFNVKTVVDNDKWVLYDLLSEEEYLNEIGVCNQNQP